MTEEIILRLVISSVLGALIGVEREIRYKEAGLRTHVLVAIGSTLIMLVSKYGFTDVLHQSTIVLDPSRIAAQVVSGIGFLGAGTILVQRHSIRGLTTAAGLWTTAGIGLAIGTGMYMAGIGTTILALIALEVLSRGEAFVKRRNARLVIQTSNVNAVLEVFSGMSLQMTDTRISYVDMNSDRAEVTLTTHLHSLSRGDLGKLVESIGSTPGIQSVSIK